MVNTPEKWIVHLHDGSTVDVWADSAEGLAGPEDDRDYRFSNLMDVGPPDRAHFDVTGETPTNPERVVVTVAVFPRSSVSRVS